MTLPAPIAGPHKVVTPSRARRVLLKRRVYLLTKADKAAALHGGGNYFLEEIDVIDWLLRLPALQASR